MNLLSRAICFSACLFLLGGCNSKTTDTSKLDYDETKKMVVDILKTDDGKKAIQEVLTDSETKQKMLMDEAAVTKAIETTLTSDKAKEFWKESFKDATFAKSYAKGLKEVHEQLLKSLMNDPEYRTKLVSILKDSELQKEYVKIMDTSDFRKNLQKLITEALENPLYQAKIQELYSKAAEEKEKKKDSSSSDKKKNSESS